MKTINDTSDFLSLAQVAKRLHISRIAVYKRIKSGNLRAFRVGRSYIVPSGFLVSGSKTPLNEAIDLSRLLLTKDLAAALKRAVWDYNISSKELFEILLGRKTTFTFSQAKLLARLLVSVEWYGLINIFGAKRLKALITDEVLDYVWSADAKKRLLFAREMLNEK